MTSQAWRNTTKKLSDLVKRVGVVDEQPDPQHGIRRDKLGATPKTDPAEIALAKEPDLYMLPSLWLSWYVGLVERCKFNVFSLLLICANLTIMACSHFILTQGLLDLLHRNAKVNRKLRVPNKDFNLKGTEYNPFVSVFFQGFNG
jgi:hypothetical protein